MQELVSNIGSQIPELFVTPLVSTWDEISAANFVNHNFIISTTPAPSSKLLSDIGDWANWHLFQKTILMIMEDPVVETFWLLTARFSIHTITARYVVEALSHILQDEDLGKISGLDILSTKVMPEDLHLPLSLGLLNKLKT